MKVGIIGGGIIGLCTAYYLLQEGHDISILDQGRFKEGTSFGNAGMIVPSHVIPLAAPGIISKGMRWMLNSKSPFHIHPRFDKDLFRWGRLFKHSATEEHVKRAVPVLKEISLLSQALYQEMADHVDFTFGLSQRGLLMLYQTITAEKEEEETAAIANKAGVEAHVLSAKEVQAMEPDEEVKALGGVYFPGDGHLDPAQLMNGLIHYLKKKKVRFFPETGIDDFLIEGNKIRQVCAGARIFSFDEVIISCGSWSPKLLKRLNLSLPLQPGKGYSFDLKLADASIHIPSLLIEGKVAMTPLENRLRCSGTMEISGLNRAVNMKKITGIVHTVNRFYPDMKVSLPREDLIWSGFRPCSPDGLPFIGRLKHLDNVAVTTGHSMMGVSLGPATGKLVSELVSGKNMDMDISVFSPERFEKKLHSQKN